MYKTICLVCCLIFIIISINVGADSIEILQKGISGSITSNICVDQINDNSLEEYCLIGTELGVYILSDNGSLINFIQTGSMVTNIHTINDMNQNHYKEVVFTIVNTYFPNVLCYDCFTGEKIWDFSSETEIFDMSMLWTTKQVNVFDLEVSTSKDYVYLTAGYDVYCLDCETGERIASFQGTDNVWDIAIVNDDVVVGDQNGYVYRLDGETLEVVWKKSVSKPYTVVNPSTKSSVGEVTRSVWEILSIEFDEKPVLAITCEDGFLYVLSFDSGNQMNAVEIIDYVDSLLYRYYGDYPIPTSSYDYNFFNMKVLAIPDISGDGETDLLVYTYPGSRTGTEYPGAKTGVYCVSSSNLQIEAKNENLDLSKISRLETLGSTVLKDTFILLPMGKTGSTEKLKLLTFEDITTEKIISVNTSSGSSYSNSYVVYSMSNDSFILCSNYGDAIQTDVNGSVIWSYQRLLDIDIEKADLLGSDTVDLLVFSKEGVENDNFLEEGSSRVLFVLDGDSNEISWSHELTYEEYLNTSGIKGIRIIDDVNGDGKKDIVGYKQRYHDWGSGDEYGEYTTVIVFSGNGEIVYEKPISENTYYGYYESYLNNPTYLAGLNPEELEWLQRDRRMRKTIESFDIISDVTGDGVSDFLIGSWNEIYIMNSTSGDLFWTRTYNKDNYEHPLGGRPNPMNSFYWDWVENDRLHYYSLGDQNNDGYEELLQVSWDSLTILRSNTMLHPFDYSVYKEISFDEDNFDTSSLRIIDDLNADSHSDIMCMVYVQDAPSVYKVLNGVSGSEIIDFEREGTTIDLGSGDGDGDGYMDSIVFYMYGSNGPLLEVLSGNNNEVLFNYVEFEESWTLQQNFGITSIMPACFISDMNGDDIEDMAIGRSLPWDTGAEIIIYDIRNNEQIKTITIESIDPDLNIGDQRWQPAVVTASVADYTGDDVGEIAVVMSLGDSSQKQLKLIVVDIFNNEIVSDFSAKGTNVESVGDMIATYGSGGELYLLNPEKQLSITTPEDGVCSSSPLTVSWSDEESDSVKIIQVDNQNIMKVTGDTAVVDIKQGARKVSVYSFDTYGKGVYANVDVTIEKSSAAQFPLLLISLLLIVLLFSPLLVSFVYRRTGSRKEDESNASNKEGEL